MEQQSSYTGAIEVQPVNAERDFARSMEQGGFGTGISGSPGREFARSPYESGGTFNNVMRQREFAQDPSHLRNIKPHTVDYTNLLRPHEHQLSGRDQRWRWFVWLKIWVETIRETGVATPVLSVDTALLASTAAVGRWSAPRVARTCTSQT